MLRLFSRLAPTTHPLFFLEAASVLPISLQRLELHRCLNCQESVPIFRIILGAQAWLGTVCHPSPQIILLFLNSSNPYANMVPIDTKPGNWTPMPEEMADPTFKADATAAFDEVPARGPYTMALGNQAIYISLPNTTPNYLSIIRKILRQTVDGSAASFLPADYRDNAALARGYRDQLAVLAKLLLNPKAPNLETPWSTGYSAPAILLHPLSRGTVRLNPADHLAQPIVDSRHGSNPVDFDMQLANVKWSRRLLDTPTMKRYGAVETAPGEAVQSDAELLAFIKSAATLSYQHPCCTAALGPKNKGGVVDNKLRVHGAKGLRVVDISVLPLVISAHTSSTAYALGEKAADVIIKEWR